MRLIRVPFLLAWPPRGRYVAQVIFPRTVFYLTGEALSMSVLRHEAGHIIQIERMGVLRYWLAWVREFARAGYEGNAIEREAEHLALTPEAHAIADRLWEADRAR